MSTVTLVLLPSFSNMGSTSTYSTISLHGEFQVFIFQINFIHTNDMAKMIGTKQRTNYNVLQFRGETSCSKKVTD